MKIITAFRDFLKRLKKWHCITALNRLKLRLWNTKKSLQRQLARERTSWTKKCIRSRQKVEITWHCDLNTRLRSCGLTLSTECKLYLSLLCFINMVLFSGTTSLSADAIGSFGNLTWTCSEMTKV